jgi:hypothetical protein
MRSAVALALPLAVSAFALMTSAVANAEPSPPPTPAGWNELVDALRGLPVRMLARLPEAQRADPQVQQEVARLALEGLASQAIDTLGADGDHPVFLPSIGQVLNIGQPNADTIYRSAAITPGGTYRLRGTRGSARLAVIAEIGPRPKQDAARPINLGPQPEVHYISRLPVDADGRYDVILSPTRPVGWTGQWWPLAPATDHLMLRLVSSDWSKEVTPTVSIERLDAAAPRPRPSAAVLETRLRALPRSVEFIAPLFVDHVEKLRAEGYVNKLKVFDVSKMGGLKGQFYYEGAYDLADDEALIVSAKAPASCLYRSIILTNPIYETTDWVNNQSSLNDAQAPLDGDGVLRIVVSAKDPGVPNWLDTAGYRQGVIQGRWTECDAQPVPQAEKVRLADLRQHLPQDTPTITPAERDRILRDRRAAQQQRPLW